MSRDFDQFLSEAETLISVKTGIHINELPNNDWRAAYENGISPAEAVWIALLTSDQ